PGLCVPRRPVDQDERVPPSGGSERTGLGGPGRLWPRLRRDAEGMARAVRRSVRGATPAARLRPPFLRSMALLPDVLRRRLPRRRDNGEPGDVGQALTLNQV